MDTVLDLIGAAIIAAIVMVGIANECKNSC